MPLRKLRAFPGHVPWPVAGRSRLRLALLPFGGVPVCYLGLEQQQVGPGSDHPATQFWFWRLLTLQCEHIASFIWALISLYTK